ALGLALGLLALPLIITPAGAHATESLRPAPITTSFEPESSETAPEPEPSETSPQPEPAETSPEPEASKTAAEPEAAEETPQPEPSEANSPQPPATRNPHDEGDGRIAGTVKPADDESAEGIKVTAEPVNDGNRSVAIADGNGRFDISLLTAGTYDVDADAEGVESVQVDLEKGEDLCGLDLVAEDEAEAPSSSPCSPEPTSEPDPSSSAPASQESMSATASPGAAPEEGEEQEENSASSHTTPNSEDSPRETKDSVNGSEQEVEEASEQPRDDN